MVPMTLPPIELLSTALGWSAIGGLVLLLLLALEKVKTDVHNGGVPSEPGVVRDLSEAIRKLQDISSQGRREAQLADEVRRALELHRKVFLHTREIYEASRTAMPMTSDRPSAKITARNGDRP
jgi:hypothetical protein